MYNNVYYYKNHNGGCVGLVENNNENGTVNKTNNNVNNSSSPGENPFTNGKLKNPTDSGNKSAGNKGGDNLSFFIFLILILLLMGNSGSFNNNFQLINDEV